MTPCPRIKISKEAVPRQIENSNQEPNDDNPTGPKTAAASSQNQKTRNYPGEAEAYNHHNPKKPPTRLYVHCALIN